MTQARNWKDASRLADTAICHAEGERGYVYACDGVLHYGIGHRLTSEELKTMKHGDQVDMETVDAAYAQDTGDAFDAVVDLHLKHPANMNAPRIAVLIEMAFCHGADGLANYTQMFNAIEREDWETASLEILKSRWYLEQGARLAAVAERVERLAKQMMTGEATA